MKTLAANIPGGADPFPFRGSYPQSNYDVPAGVNMQTGAVRVEVVSGKAGGAPSSTSIITNAADIVLGVGESLRIQNLGTAVLFVKRGSGASSSSFNYALKACTVNDDATGDTLVIDDYAGTVSFSSSSVRYIAWK